MIFNEDIKKQTPKACEYFEKIFSGNETKLSPSIILYGDNTELNYKFALEIARALNCEKDKSYDCDCLNCRWIRDNKHPEVKTFSNLENKTDKTTTTISVEQIRNIADEIVVTSDYKRVYIFCGAREGVNDAGEKTYIHLPLTGKILASEPSNALLKSIEEPPANTYFIFLARDKEDLLQTIISRSQAFYIHSKELPLPELNGIEEVFKYYPYRDYQSTKEFTQRLEDWQKENKLTLEQTIDYSQEYLKNLLETNINDKNTTNTITSDIFKFEEARKMAQTKFKDFVIYENLTYKLYKD